MVWVLKLPAITGIAFMKKTVNSSQVRNCTLTAACLKFLPRSHVRKTTIPLIERLAFNDGIDAVFLYHRPFGLVGALLNRGASLAFAQDVDDPQRTIWKGASVSADAEDNPPGFRRSCTG